jgi:hypothetical protein
LSLPGQRRSNVSYRDLRRRDNELVGQTQHAKALLTQPSVSIAIFRLPFVGAVTRSVDLHDQPFFKASEVSDEIAKRDLSTELCAFASPISQGAPKNALRLNGVLAQVAGETQQHRTWDIGGHDARIAEQTNPGKAHSRIAPLDSPHPKANAKHSSATFANAKATFSRKGRRAALYAARYFGSMRSRPPI